MHEIDHKSVYRRTAANKFMVTFKGMNPTLLSIYSPGSHTLHADVCNY